MPSPPKPTFQKGTSGDPKGRPKNRHSQVPYDAVLWQMVTIREDVRTRRVAAAEAFILQLTQKSLAGDSAAAVLHLQRLRARANRLQDDTLQIERIVIKAYGIGSALKALGLAYKKYASDKARVRWELNPWIVEAALARLGERTLTKEEQREVYRHTRTPRKVNWPSWWSEFD